MDTCLVTDPRAETAELVRRWQAGDSRAFEAMVTQRATGPTR
jgi:hypothetical protein